MRHLILLLISVLMTACGMVQGHDQSPTALSGYLEKELVREEASNSQILVYKLKVSTAFKYELLKSQIKYNASNSRYELTEIDIECGEHNTVLSSYDLKTAYNLHPNDTTRISKSVVGVNADDYTPYVQNYFANTSLGRTDTYYSAKYNYVVVGGSLPRCTLN